MSRAKKRAVARAGAGDEGSDGRVPTGCRRRSVIPAETGSIPGVPSTLKPGALVQFYDEGLRAGYLVSVTSTIAKIQPIGAYKALKPRAKRVPIEDVVCAPVTHGEGPTKRNKK